MRAAVVEPLGFNVVQFDGTRVVVVEGEVDIATAPELDELLSEFDRVRVVVDLENVTFIDWSGLKTLVEAHERLRKSGGDLTVRNASAMTLKVFQITRLDEVVLTDGSREPTVREDQVA
jgi:anti-anti-sigma factor